MQTRNDTKPTITSPSSKAHHLPRLYHNEWPQRRPHQSSDPRNPWCVAHSPQGDENNWHGTSQSWSQWQGAALRTSIANNGHHQYRPSPIPSIANTVHGQYLPSLTPSMANTFHRQSRSRPSLHDNTSNRCQGQGSRCDGTAKDPMIASPTARAVSSSTVPSWLADSQVTPSS